MKLSKVMTLAAVIGGVAQAQTEGDPVPNVDIPGVGVAEEKKGKKSFGNGTLPEVLVPFDVNEDGKLDKEEALAMRDARKAARNDTKGKSGDFRNVVDTDGDGKVSVEERVAMVAKVKAAIEARRAEKFAKVAGPDGKLSLEEFSALPPLKNKTVERVESVFNRLDVDENGTVTVDEFQLRLRKRPGRTTPSVVDDPEADGRVRPQLPESAGKKPKEIVVVGD